MTNNRTVSPGRGDASAADLLPFTSKGHYRFSLDSFCELVEVINFLTLTLTRLHARHFAAVKIDTAVSIILCALSLHFELQTAQQSWKYTCLVADGSQYLRMVRCSLDYVHVVPY